ncbi:5,10-methenyltetrahydrofolate synthetase [Paracoccus isoporae]|uniref:5-formyltetrahydrofolate cyclo-ligase n=1 Tax=Paracoccus isoporae TaxID=591205 RepID=A0A1G6T4N7_9RHOB|nr:5-formyltetrahydrofolate cyclo-ligase [Paracoccus isoporae]SDD24120.1 5,10-methenyltetrahydrofolate synthetase [Paracoccus isoporae]
MGGMNGDDETRDYASPACMAGQVSPGHFDPAAGASGLSAKASAAWRKQERARLLAARAAMGEAARQAAEEALAARLNEVLSARFAGGAGLVLGGFWPIRGEPDLRGWMARRAGLGQALALPVVVAPDAPLIFRPWQPGAAMRPGRFDIPEPDTAAEVMPQILLVPLVGWDAARFRMGYGGGFYDRTLAGMRPRPYAIGVGHAAGRLDTIRPQPHDEALDLIVTEDGVV